MALEATLVLETHQPVPFTVADGAGIEKGTVLKLTDPNTAVASDGDNDVIAGIAAEEKIANDGKVRLAVYRGGHFKMTAGGAITVGAPVNTNASTGAANEVVAAGINDENVLGIALETASDTDTLLVELRPTTMQLA